MRGRDLRPHATMRYQDPGQPYCSICGDPILFDQLAEARLLNDGTQIFRHMTCELAGGLLDEREPAEAEQKHDRE